MYHKKERSLTNIINPKNNAITVLVLLVWGYMVFMCLINSELL